MVHMMSTANGTFNGGVYNYLPISKLQILHVSFLQTLLPCVKLTKSIPCYFENKSEAERAMSIYFGVNMQQAAKDCC